MFVGVDGYRKGWVAIRVDGSGFVGAGCFPSFGELVAAYADARSIGVDMPIGLMDGPDREADQAARDFLRGNASSVFNAPVRSALKASSYAQASAITKAKSDKGLSQQSYNIIAKVAEVDAYVKDERIVEVHPEVSFRLMNGGRLEHGKKTWGGLRARLALLKAAGIELPASLGEVDAVGIDDVVDAAAAAWSARRVSAGTARSFPGAPLRQRDRGRRIAIWG